jgi:uncharacterized protein (TIGR00369 family)
MADDSDTGWAPTAPFTDHLAAEVVSARDGVAELMFRAQPHFANRKGNIHGGAIAAVMDMAASAAMRSKEPGLKGLATMTLNVAYIEPAGQEIRFTARVVKSGRSTAWIEVRATGSGDSIVATASLTMRLIR